jgi:UDP-3-O-[3-hydroxymyristoyl] glucosamine N-acyltransferase
MTDFDAPGLVLSPRATVGRDVVFGAHVVVYDSVVIGDGVRIEDGAILGKVPRLSARSDNAAAIADPLRIGAGTAICAQAILFAGCTIGEGAIVGDQAYVRERSRIGAGTVVGRGSSIVVLVSASSTHLGMTGISTSSRWSAASQA